MDNWRQFRTEVEELERINLISLPMIKRWFLLLGTTVAIFCYLWNSIFRGTGFDHFPASMVHFENDYKSKITFMSEAEARKFQLREINIVITASSKQIERKSPKEHLEPSIVKDAVVTMKSTVMHTKKVIHFHIFTTDHLYQYFIARLDNWPNYIRHRVSFNFYPTVYPETVSGEYEDENDEPYRSPLLFVPHILKEIDHVMFIRPGGVFLQSVDLLWSNMEDYNTDNVLSLAPFDINSMCPVSREALTIDKVYSSSVILLDLYKLRTAVFHVPVKMNGYNLEDAETELMTWSPRMILSHVKTFSSKLMVTEQDILNLMAYYNPQTVKQLSYKWNFNANKQQSARSMLKSFLIFSSFDKWNLKLKNHILNADFRNHTLTDLYLQTS
uniref:Glucoside xylosyltransferase 2-like n=1 Tax=Phallusia mammillata TaxID=59560 RepID=A0A6F9DER2_9ASCI|nr:glucoside xylosyltransferase 2-like [Phallusia mammillata]